MRNVWRAVDKEGCANFEHLKIKENQQKKVQKAPETTAILANFRTGLEEWGLKTGDIIDKYE